MMKTKKVIEWEKNEVYVTRREALVKGGWKSHLNGTLAVSMRRGKRWHNKTVRMKNVKKIFKMRTIKKKLTYGKLSTRTSNTGMGEKKNQRCRRRCWKIISWIQFYINVIYENVIYEYLIISENVKKNEKWKLYIKNVI